MNSVASMSKKLTFTCSNVFAAVGPGQGYFVSLAQFTFSALEHLNNITANKPFWVLINLDWACMFGLCILSLIA